MISKTANILILLSTTILFAGCNETRPQNGETAEIRSPSPKPKIRLVPQYGVVKRTPVKSAATSLPANSSPKIVEFTEKDRRTILQYYKSRSSNTHNTQLNRASSTELAKLKKSGQWKNRLKEKNLPYALERKLSSLPPGYSRKQIGHHLLIRNLNTNEVVDFIMDIAY